MDVANRLQHLRLSLDPDGMEPALEEVASPAAAPVNPEGVVLSERLHDLREALLAHLQGNMDVVRHEAVAVDPAGVPPDRLAQVVDEVPSVLVGVEYSLTVVSAQRHMVNEATTPWDGSRELSGTGSP
jgi:hypothetical protein